MDRWIGKIAVVTGASSGIGAAITKDLLNYGLIVIGLARRTTEIEALKTDLSMSDGKLYSYKCDISDLPSIKETFEEIKNKFGGINILINNAGISRCGMILSDDNEMELAKIVNTNLLGLVYCTKEAYKLMKISDGFCQIININSILGHAVTSIPNEMPTFNIYPATKYGIRAITEIIRQELLYLQIDKKIKISSISPGLVKTNIFRTAQYPNDEDIFKQNNHLTPEDISETLLYLLSTPHNVQIQDLLIKPNGGFY